ncbi:hypothetical protein [Candidatus Liberibacter sp.]|nr:hypothetical protein [Candidatus Liberibacter sp.]MBA5723806.1 hypothetical protein [Candidatus Liberibacter sp.]
MTRVSFRSDKADSFEGEIFEALLESLIEDRNALTKAIRSEKSKIRKKVG